MRAFDEGSRRTLEALGDVLIPAEDGMPSASGVGVGGELLDRVLAARWDLADALAALLEAARGRDPAAVVAGLQASDPDAFTVLATFVAGGYFMDGSVRERLGYHGQHAVAIRPADVPNPELLASVRSRGPTYVPTPPPAG